MARWTQGRRCGRNLKSQACYTGRRNIPTGNSKFTASVIKPLSFGFEIWLINLTEELDFSVSRTRFFNLIRKVCLHSLKFLHFLSSRKVHRNIYANSTDSIIVNSKNVNHTQLTSRISGIIDIIELNFGNFK